MYVRGQSKKTQVRAHQKLNENEFLYSAFFFVSKTYTPKKWPIPEEKKNVQCSPDWANHFQIELTGFLIELKFFSGPTSFPIKLIGFPIQLTLFLIQVTGFPIRLTYYYVSMSDVTNQIQVTSYQIRLLTTMSLTTIRLARYPNKAKLFLRCV